MQHLSDEGDFIGLVRLKKLLANNNQLHYIHPDSVPPGLRLLHLEYNNLTQIPKQFKSHNNGPVTGMPSKYAGKTHQGK